LITLLHPSRGRADQAKETANYWYHRASDPTKVEYILSVDNSDPKKWDYRDRFAEILFPNKKFLINDNETVVQATNHAAKQSNGEILVYLSDDFHCPKGWDNLIHNRTKDLNKPWLLKVDDCYQAFNKDVLTIPIMNRALYSALNYFWHPEYRSMFVDQDLYYVAKNMNALVNAADLRFEHMHPVAGKGKHDETYARSNQNWNQGKELYARRQRQNFPL
jgi:hypothetical protein